MIRFANYREAFLYKVYRNTVENDGAFRFQTTFDPLPQLGLAKAMVLKCLLGLIQIGHLVFRQDSSGSQDGYEITAAGIEYVEAQLDLDNLPIAGTAIFQALVAEPDAAPEEFDPNNATPAPESPHLTQEHAPEADNEADDDGVFLSSTGLSDDLLIAIVAAVVGDYHDAVVDATGGEKIIPELSHASVRARAKLLVAPGAPAALLDGLVSAALSRLAEMGVTATRSAKQTSTASASLLIKSVAVPNAQASGP